ncbi:hypothetical protein C8R47DRAFT_1071444 [Mycena vitilis]|nr:hypothetical protein C8R47DRAFT_1071444 [Mycena vitilis]
MEELLDISEMDPHAVAKKDQVPEVSYGGRPIPLRWCKIGPVVRKNAAARIPPDFVHATAYYADGEDPLSDPPGSPMEVEVAEGLNAATRGVKRAREHDFDDEVAPRTHPQAHPAPLRRSTRSRGRKVQSGLEHDMA